MTLPNALLLPFALLPITVYEPRYRKMITYALEHDRMFCIALMKPGSKSALKDEEFYQTAGMGLIRACVRREDGVYNLILQGLVRVRLVDWVKVRPFRVAKIAPLPSEPAEGPETDALSARVLQLCHELKDKGAQVPIPVEKQLASIDDPSALADIVSHTFIRDPFARQQLLEELSVPTRLRRLITRLQEELLA
jgi:Lon protease-like protein